MESRGSAVVIIEGQRYDKFLSLTLKRSIEEGTCSGTVVLSWPGAEAFNISSAVAPAFSAGAEGEIILDGQTAGKVIFDTRISKGTSKHYELTLQFRGQASELVDSSPDHESGQFNRQKPAQIIRAMMQGFKTQLQEKGGGSAQQAERFIIAEGETIERAARRCAREYGLLLYENPEGNWVLASELGMGGGGRLEIGRDFTQWSVKADIVPRFTKLGMVGTGIPTDDKYGGGQQGTEQIWNQAQGMMGGGGGGMANRMLRVLVDGDHTKQSIEKRGKFEQQRRSSSGLNVTLKTATWTDEGGQLWEVAKSYHVKIPVDQVDDDCKLTEVEFELTPDSRSATLVLTSENAWGGGGPENVLGTANAGKGSVLYDAPVGPQQPSEPTAPQTPPPPAPPEVAAPSAYTPSGTAIRRLLGLPTS